MISIITPVYNREKTIVQTIESVENQTFDNWELIIIDDGSTDNSVDIIEKYVKKDSRIKLFHRDRDPKGPTTCRNIGVEKSEGDYIIFLDSDDLLAPWCLEQRYELMQSNSHWDFAVFPIELFRKETGDLKILFNKHFDNKTDYLKSFLIDQPPWQIMGPIWKKKTFIKIGGFDENFWVMDDPELHVRALLNNINFIDVKDAKVDCFYRVNYDKNFNIKKFYKDSIEGRIKFIKKVYLLLLKSGDRDLINLLKKSIKIICKNWFFANIRENKNSIFDFFIWARTNNLISKKDYFLAILISKLWLNDNKIIRMFKIKGGLTLLFK